MAGGPGCWESAGQGERTVGWSVVGVSGGTAHGPGLGSAGPRVSATDYGLDEFQIMLWVEGE